MKNWNLIRIFEKINHVKLQSTSLLTENVQLADKIYFKTGKLDANQKQTVMSITNGDNHTKFIADSFYYLIKQKYISSDPIKELRNIYDQITTYNKNVFPIKGLTDINNSDVDNILYALQKRSDIIKLFKTFPSTATRNLKAEIRQERNGSEMEDYRHLTEYVAGHIGYIMNRDEKTQNKILQKMFKNGATMEQLVDFVEEKVNLLGGINVTRNLILNVVKENIDDMKIVYESGKIMVVRVESPEAIKNIGCTSLWCFTYGKGFENAYRQWNEYSTDDMVYVIIDFSSTSDSSDFMHVVIKPLDWEEEEGNEDGDGVNSMKVFDMGNDQLETPLPFMSRIFGLENAKRIFTFEWD